MKLNFYYFFINLLYLFYATTCIYINRTLGSLCFLYGYRRHCMDIEGTSTMLNMSLHVDFSFLTGKDKK